MKNGRVIEEEWKANDTCRCFQHQDASDFWLRIYPAHFRDRKVNARLLSKFWTVIQFQESSLYLKTMVTHSMTLFLDIWIVPGGEPKCFLWGNRRQFLSRFYEKLSGFLRVKHVVPTAFQPQARGPVERCNKTIVASSSNHVAEQKDNCDIFFQPRTSLSDTQVHLCIEVPSFSLVLALHQPKAETLDVLSANCLD